MPGDVLVYYISHHGVSVCLPANTIGRAFQKALPGQSVRVEVFPKIETVDHVSNIIEYGKAVIGGQEIGVYANRPDYVFVDANLGVDNGSTICPFKAEFFNRYPEICFSLFSQTPMTLGFDQPNVIDITARTSGAESVVSKVKDVVEHWSKISLESPNKGLESLGTKSGGLGESVEMMKYYQKPLPPSIRAEFFKPLQSQADPDGVREAEIESELDPVEPESRPSKPRSK